MLMSMAGIIDFVTTRWMLSSALAIGLSLFLWASGVFQKRHKNAPPIVSSAIPFFGPFISFAKSPVGFIRQTYDKLGDVFTMQMFGQRLTFLIGPDAHAAFFRASDQDASQAEVYKFMTPVFGRGIVYDAPTKTRIQQLKFVAQSLKTTQLKTYSPKILQETDMYLSQWGDAGERNLLEAMSELTILTASRTLMGKEIRETLFAEVSALYSDLDAGITPLSVFFPRAPVPSHWKRNRARAEMVKIFAKVIQKRRNSTEKQDDCLQAFIDCKYKDGTSLNDDSITGLMIALLFAGQHTSSITTCYTLLHLAHNPSILARVLDEQKAVLGSLDPDVPVNFEQLQKMTVLDVCIKEVLRLHPPLIFLMRKLKTDMVIGKHTVPAGDTIFASPAVSMRLPSVFADPNTFNPDRFLTGEPEAAYSFIGFGGGMHSCVGESFARTVQVKTIVSSMIRRYELTPTHPTAPEEDYKAMVVGPKSEQCHVRYKRRVVA